MTTLPTPTTDSTDVKRWLRSLLPRRAAVRASAVCLLAWFGAAAIEFLYAIHNGRDDITADMETPAWLLFEVHNAFSQMWLPAGIVTPIVLMLVLPGSRRRRIVETILGAAAIGAVFNAVTEVTNPLYKAYHYPAPRFTDLAYYGDQLYSGLTDGALGGIAFFLIFGGPFLIALWLSPWALVAETDSTDETPEQ